MVDASGNSIVSAPTSDADPDNIVVNYEGRPQDVEDLNTDASPINEDLEQAIKKSTSFTTADQQISEQATVAELKTKNERLKSDLQSKSDENSSLHIQSKICLWKRIHKDDRADRFFDVQFRVSFEDLRTICSYLLVE